MYFTRKVKNLNLAKVKMMSINLSESLIKLKNDEMIALITS